MSPTISLLVPVYNSQEKLNPLLDSIDNMESVFDEVIFYDDYSNDKTVKLLEQRGYNVIRGNSNKGAASGRNILLESTNSDYVHFHDSDDSFSPDLIKQFLKSFYLYENNESNCFISNMTVCKNGKVVSEVNYNDLDKTIDFVDYFLNKNGFAIIGFYPKSLLQRIGGFDSSLKGNEDPDLHVRLAVNGAKFIPLNKALVTNHISDTSFSSTNWKKCMEDKLVCLFKYVSILDKRYLPTIAREAVLLSNYFYREKDKKNSALALNLLKTTKIKHINISVFQKIISRIFGIRFYIWLYRKRVDLNII